MDVYVDGSKLLDDFTFGSVTSYVPVAAGSHRIQAASDGKGAAASVIGVTASLLSQKERQWHCASSFVIDVKNVLIVKVLPLLFACKQTCCRVLYAVVLRDSS